MTNLNLPMAAPARAVVTAVLLLVAVACAATSVWSSSRAACALWVAVAVVTTFAAGWCARSRRTATGR